MILRLPSVQWVVIASILALLIAWLLQSQILLSQLKGKPRSLTFYEELRLQIDQIRYNTSDIRLKTLFPSSRNFKSSTPSLASVSINSVADALTSVKDRKPFLFKSPEILSWKLLTSDVWDLAYRWPLLTAVLQLKVDIKRHIDSRLMPLFIAEIEPPEGGVLGVAQEAGRPEVTDEMLFAHLLLQLKIDENKFFYSTNFRIMERIVNVRSLFCSITYLISFITHLLFIYSCVYSLQTAISTGVYCYMMKDLQLIQTSPLMLHLHSFGFSHPTAHCRLDIVPPTL